MALEHFIEEVQVLGHDVLDKIKALVHEGNAKRVIVKDTRGNTFVEIPVTVAAVSAVAAPVIAAISAIAMMVSQYTLAIERVDRSQPTSQSDGTAYPRSR